MKKFLMTAVLGLCAASAFADGYKPFVVVDTGMERDNASLVHDYINANLTVGVKGPNKMEYSLKLGGSQKSAEGVETYSRNIEGKIKKSFDIGMPFIPYVSGRLGQKTKNNGDGHTTPHWAIDAGLKYPMTTQFALDVGIRYRDAFNSEDKYRSTRYHVMGLYEIDPQNVIGLRFTTSTSNNNPEEERNGWRLHYQHNY